MKCNIRHFGHSSVVVGPLFGGGRCSEVLYESSPLAADLEVAAVQR